MDPWRPYLILGIGNCLLSDDGVGVHAVRILQAQPPSETTILAIETDFLSAIPFLERCVKALVIDAMDGGRPPGTLYYCRSTDLADSGQRHSLHGLGLLGILEFLNEKRHPEIQILGVQPCRRGLGLSLSPQVASVLPQVVRAAHRIVGGSWRTCRTSARPI